MKQRSSRFDSPRIAQQINLALELNINKDIIRRILDRHYKATSSDNKPP